MKYQTFPAMADFTDILCSNESKLHWVKEFTLFLVRLIIPEYEKDFNYHGRQ